MEMDDTTKENSVPTTSTPAAGGKARRQLRKRLSKTIATKHKPSKDIPSMVKARGRPKSKARANLLQQPSRSLEDVSNVLQVNEHDETQYVANMADEPAPNNPNKGNKISDFKIPEPLIWNSWESFLRAGHNFQLIPSVDFFKYAPFANVWNEWGQTPGLLFELPNIFVRSSARPVHWFGRVVLFAGYNALVQYESFGLEPKFLAWVSYFSDIPRPIGYAKQAHIYVYPPHDVAAVFPDFVVRGREKFINGILPTHRNRVLEVLDKCKKYSLSDLLEVPDLQNPTKMRLATVVGIVGDRIHVVYNEGVKRPLDLTRLHISTLNGFLWFNVNSDQVHPVGWSHAVLEADSDEALQGYAKLSPTYFPSVSSSCINKLEKGQVLEVRHPIKLDRICAASVHKVLKHGYFIVDIRTTKLESRKSVKYLFHVTSPYIFHCNFTKETITKEAGKSTMEGFELIPPHGEPQDLFSWDEYLSRLSLKPAPLHLRENRPPHKFKPGMKLEVVLFSKPSVITSATILETFEHLLFIQYDDFERNTIWIDAQSPDIYPIGYSQLVGHSFEGKIASPNFNIMVDKHLFLYTQ